MTGRKKLIIATVVWGDWYVNALLDYAVPSLLAPNNFPGLARECDLEFMIITRPAEQPRIEASPAIQSARRFMAVHVFPALPPVIDSSVNVFQFHHMMWNFAHERGKRERCHVFNLSPDSVFSDGAGECWARLIYQGMTSLLWWFPRALDTVMPLLRQRYLAPDGAITVSPRELVRLNLEYIHPLSAALFVDSPNFLNFHPEMVMWRIPGEGVLIRGFAGEARIFDPGKVELTGQQLVTGNLEGCTLIDDSDSMYMMSLTPPRHNADWYKAPDRVDPSQIGRWWLNFDSESGYLVANRPVRVHAGKRTAALWHARERQSNLLVSRAAASREFFRAARGAFACDCTWVAALLTMVARTRACLRIFPRPMQTIIFGPADAAIGNVSLGELLKPNASAQLTRLLRSHVVVNDQPGVNLADRVSQAGGVLRLRTLAGKDITVARRPDGRLMVNRYKVGLQQSQIRGHTFFPIDGILDEEAAGRAPSQISQSQ